MARDENSEPISLNGSSTARHAPFLHNRRSPNLFADNQLNLTLPKFDEVWYDEV